MRQALHTLAAIFIVLALALSLNHFFNFQNFQNYKNEGPKEDFMASVLPPVLAMLTNKDRAENDAAPLTQSELLSKAAQMKADDMAARGYFSHVTPDGKTPWYFFQKVGYKYAYAGENLAVNYFDSIDVAKAWMNSPTHRANVIKKNYTQIGFGISEGLYNGKNTVFVVEFFGTPLAKTAKPKAKTTIK